MSPRITSDGMVPRSLANAPGATREQSFSQRQAWMREYECAALQGEHAAGAAGQGGVAAQGAAAAAQAAASPGAQSQVAPLASTQGQVSAQVPAASRTSAAAACRPPAAPMAGQQPLNQLPLQPQQAGPHVGARLALRGDALRLAPAPGGAAAEAFWAQRHHAARVVSVFSTEAALSLVIRDAQLAPGDEQAVMQQLNAQGLTQGRKRVSVTVNGRQIEQQSSTEKD